MNTHSQRIKFAVALRDKRMDSNGRQKASANHYLLNKVSKAFNEDKLHTLTGEAFDMYLEILKSTK